MIDFTGSQLITFFSHKTTDMSTLSIATIRRISTTTRSLSIRSSSSTQSTQEISSTTLRNVIETDEELRQLSISSNSSSLPSEPSHTQNRDLRLNDIISRMESSATRTVRIRQRLAEDREFESTYLIIFLFEIQYSNSKEVSL